MTSFIASFQELTAQDVAIAGGKGASLGEMTQAGIPVPPGFVILAPAFEEFLKSNRLTTKIENVVKNVNPEDYQEVEKRATTIQQWILEKPLPQALKKAILKAYKALKSPYVAVRSSATAEDSSSAAWAGQLESYLNTTQKTLLENIKKCWASLFTPRAIIYRLTKKLAKKKISVAVVVQKMVQSEKSGIAFSVHPVTQDENEMIIEAGYGLGEAIVSGQITPDSYILQKEPLTIKEKHISEQKKALSKGKKENEWKPLGEKGKKQKIPDNQILKLANIILAIEDHYGFPVDVEFAYEKNQWYIVQSRPITTLQKTKKKEKISAKEPSVQDYLHLLFKEEILIESADGYPLFFEITTREFTRSFGPKLFAYSLGTNFARKGNVRYISLKKDHEKIGKNVLHYYTKRKKTFLTYYQQWEKSFQELKQFYYEAFQKDLKKLSEKELFQHHEEVWKKFTKTRIPGFLDGFTFYADKAFVEMVKNFCEKKGIRDYVKIYSLLSLNTTPSFLAEREMALYSLYKILRKKGYTKRNNLRRFLEKHSSLYKKIQQHLLDYSYSKSGYFGYQPYTLEDIQKSFQEFAKKIPSLAEFKRNKKRKEMIIKKYHLPKEIILFEELIDLVTRWKDQRSAFHMMYATLKDKITHEFARRKKLPYNLLIYAFHDELNALLKKKISTKKLKRRSNGILYFYKDGKRMGEISGVKAYTLLKKLEKKKDTHKRIL